MTHFLKPVGVALSLTAVLLTSACAVGPNYQAPQAAPVAYLNADANSFNAAANPEANWWGLFGDPVLDKLEAQALAGNLGLRVAADRMEQARALFRDARLDKAPRITSNAGYTANKEQVPGFTTTPIHTNSYTVGLDAAWEIDLFGHVQHEVEAAHADAEAARADLRGAQVSIAAEVAETYFDLRGAQARLAVARSNLESQSETLRLTQVRFDVGNENALALASVQARLNAIEAAIPAFAAEEKAANYRLAVLTGQRPGALDQLLAPQVGPAPALVQPLPIGDAADLLRRRPDVQAAERRLAAQTARVGVATADLFPRVSVTGFIGFLSGDFSSLAQAGGRAWSIAPTVTWPALDLGGARARLQNQTFGADATLAQYDQTVLTALADLETAFVAYGQQQAEVKSLTDQVTASRRASDLAQIQYKEGRIDFLVLLDAQRTSLAAEDALATAETGVNTAVVGVYKALGGGWTA
jgi:multidrug efflux system outer membrane protein